MRTSDKLQGDGSWLSFAKSTGDGRREKEVRGQECLYNRLVRMAATESSQPRKIPGIEGTGRKAKSTAAAAIFVFQESE